MHLFVDDVLLKDSLNLQFLQLQINGVQRINF